MYESENLLLLRGILLESTGVTTRKALCVEDLSIASTDLTLVMGWMKQRLFEDITSAAMSVIVRSGESQSRNGVFFNSMWWLYRPSLKRSPIHLATCENYEQNVY